MKPNYMKENSTIYLIAPSFGCTTSPYKQRLQRAIKNFKKLNYKIIIGENCNKNDGVAASNTPKQRAKEFMLAYESDADVILSVGGGETMIEILEYINFNRIKKLPPKWFVGFSDNTNLTYTLTTICDIETIYGNNAPSFYIQPLQYDTLDTLELLKGKKIIKGYHSFQFYDDKKIYPEYHFDHKKEITVYQYQNPFEGILLGGCLDCLINLCGTKYDYTQKYCNKYKDEGIIFYFEACDLTTVGIRRGLFQLKSAGWFQHVKGFLIGRTHYYYDTFCGTTPLESYIDLLKDFNVPLLLNVDLGHIPPSMPMRNGAHARVTYKDENIIIEYKE